MLQQRTDVVVFHFSICEKLANVWHQKKQLHLSEEPLFHILASLKYVFL